MEANVKLTECIQAYFSYRASTLTAESLLLQAEIAKYVKNSRIGSITVTGAKGHFDT